MKRLIRVKLDPETDSEGNQWITILKQYLFEDGKKDYFTFRLMLHEFKELQIQVDNLIMKKR